MPSEQTTLQKTVAGIRAMDQSDLFDAWVESDYRSTLYFIGLVDLLEAGHSKAELDRAYNLETAAQAWRDGPLMAHEMAWGVL